MEGLADFLVPQPLSPAFLPGGRLEGLNEDLTMILGVMLLLFLLDVAVVQRYLQPKARYFALHVVANFVSACAAAPDVYRLLNDPIHAFSGPSYTMMANSAVAAIHLYHVIAFKLPMADVFHHATFVSVLCGIAIPYKQVGGAANNFGCFFLSGLPGGIDYVMLVMVQQGAMHWLTEKRLNAWINTWIRGPSMVVYGFTAWMVYRLGTCQFGALELSVVGGLHFFNGQYYAEMAIGNYHYRRGKMQAELSASEQRSGKQADKHKAQ